MSTAQAQAQTYSFTMPACPTCSAGKSDVVSLNIETGVFTMRCTEGHPFTVTPK